MIEATQRGIKQTTIPNVLTSVFQVVDLYGKPISRATSRDIESTFDDISSIGDESHTEILLSYCNAKKSGKNGSSSQEKYKSLEMNHVFVKKKRKTSHSEVHD